MVIYEIEKNNQDGFRRRMASYAEALKKKEDMTKEKKGSGEHAKI